MKAQELGALHSNSHPRVYIWGMTSGPVSIWANAVPQGISRRMAMSFFPEAREHLSGKVTWAVWDSSVRVLRSFISWADTCCGLGRLVAYPMQTLKSRNEILDHLKTANALGLSSRTLNLSMSFQSLPVDALLDTWQYAEEFEITDLGSDLQFAFNRMIRNMTVEDLMMAFASDRNMRCPVQSATRVLDQEIWIRVYKPEVSVSDTHDMFAWAQHENYCYVAINYVARQLWQQGLTNDGQLERVDNHVKWLYQLEFWKHDQHQAALDHAAASRRNAAQKARKQKARDARGPPPVDTRLKSNVANPGARITAYEKGQTWKSEQSNGE